ncbi:MAG TPA: trehalase family glycosidase, partial [Gemmatimonadales bacterium]|nr:trehalase family glycosidase [Gemmatimonadales bacterium]
MSSERRAMGRPALLRPASPLALLRPARLLAPLRLTRPLAPLRPARPLAPLRPTRRLWSWLPASLLGLATALTMAAGCRPGTAAGRPASPPAPIASTRYEFAGWYEPARDLGPLFRDVQLSGIFADSKTFADARPLRDPAGIVARYAATRGSTGFSLRAFVEAQFELPRPAAEGFRADSAGTMEAHIGALWPVLTRAPSDQPRGHGSLIRLPHPYVVPGGRFREVYYWDSYFTMLGLVESGRTALVQSMLDNFAWLVGRIGHIPNGNRTYYLGRSQPPYFAAMVGLYARAADTTRALRYLRALEAEHRFWMDGAERLAPGQADRRVVRLPDGSVLNRYWDDLPEP